MPELIGESLPKQLRDFGLLQGQAELTYTTQDLLLDADVFTQKGDFILSGSFYGLPTKVLSILISYSWVTCLKSKT